MPHRRPATFAAAAALLLCATVSGAMPAAATAEGALHYVDIVLTEGDSRCTAERVQVATAPPSRVAIDADKVGFDCSGSPSFKFAGDAAFDFDDVEGTATATRVRIAATKFGVTCTYEAATVQLDREGTTREYVGGPVRGKKVKGSFLCPGSVNLDEAEVVFHQ